MQVNENLMRFASILLKEKYPEFQSRLELCESEAEHTYRLAEFAEEQRLMFWIDWTGEDEHGEVADDVRQILQQQGITGFEWDNDAFMASVDFSTLGRGDYPSILFKAIDQRLQTIQCRLVYVMMGDDAYHFTVLRENDFQAVDRLSWLIYGVYGEDSQLEYDPIALLEQLEPPE